MRFDRAATFGILGSIGFAVVWPITFALIRETRTGVEGGTAEGDVTVLFLLAGATTVSLVFLFALVGEYVDRELEDRGIADPRE